MRWWQFALVGGVGGALAEFVALFKYVKAWQEARRSPSGTLSEDPVSWRKYVDVPAHVWMLAMRMLAGMASAGAFAAGGQIKGAFAAIALGYGGPVVLERLGHLQLVDSLVNRTAPASPPAVASASKSMPAASLASPEGAPQATAGGGS